MDGVTDETEKSAEDHKGDEKTVESKQDDELVPGAKNQEGDFI